MQFGDVLLGKAVDDLIIGRLGTDVISGARGDDVLIGGIEHFNPLNRDRAFGGRGNDIFIWKPGDGSDLFRGGSGKDVVIFGLIGELNNGNVEFGVVNDQKAGDVAINRRTGLPVVDVTNSPGFCTVIDASTSPDAAQQLAALDIDTLVQFSIRAIAEDFASGVQTDDNGLRVTLHLKDVEYVVCTDRNGGVIEILDIRQAPAQAVSLDDIASRKLRNRLRRILK